MLETPQRPQYKKFPLVTLGTALPLSVGANALISTVVALRNPEFRNISRGKIIVRGATGAVRQILMPGFSRGLYQFSYDQRKGMQEMSVQNALGVVAGLAFDVGITALLVKTFGFTPHGIDIGGFFKARLITNVLANVGMDLIQDISDPSFHGRR